MDTNPNEGINEIELGSKQRSKLNKVAPENQDDEQFSHGENMEDDDDLEEQDHNNENSKDNSLNKSVTENQEDFDFAEEPESRDKIIRKELDKYLTQHPAGKVIQTFIAITSVISSVTFIVMTHYEWSDYGECC